MFVHLLVDSFTVILNVVRKLQMQLIKFDIFIRFVVSNRIK